MRVFLEVAEGYGYKPTVGNFNSFNSSPEYSSSCSLYYCTRVQELAAFTMQKEPENVSEQSSIRNPKDDTCKKWKRGDQKAHMSDK